MSKLLIIGGVSLIVISIVVVILLVVMKKDSNVGNKSLITINPMTIGPIITNSPGTTRPAPLVPSDYQLYGDYVNTAGNTRVQHIAFVPEINQNVFMNVTVQNGVQSFLKMVSQDNSQARFIAANPTDIASQLFDASKWNNGYGVVDGHYKVIKPSAYEMYGSAINNGTPMTVQYVVYDPDAKQAVFMVIDNGFLKMVSQDNRQARNTPASITDTPVSLYQYGKWNNGYTNVAVGNYNVRRKN